MPNGSEFCGGDKGILFGKKVAVKDSVAVAGMPMDGGSQSIKDYIPSLNAEVVKRVIACGGTIIGKTTCEDLCYSSLSHTSKHGPVMNPFDSSRTSGGSSSGNAVALALREVDMAVGTDTGCSIRVPSALCGCVGLKPTYGLVPMTGCMACIPTTDHVGPMATSVQNCALLLEAIAGPEIFSNPVLSSLWQPKNYSNDVNKGIKGLKAALILEGFSYKNESSRKISETVLLMSDKLKDHGLEVQTASISHLMTEASDLMWILSILEFEQSVKAKLQPYLGRQTYMTDLKAAVTDLGNSLPKDGLKAVLAADIYRREISKWNMLEKTINRVKLLAEKVDAVFSKYDVLILPTVPFPAPKLPIMAEQEDEGEVYEGGRSKERRGTDPKWKHGHQRSGTGSITAISVNCGFIELSEDEDQEKFEDSRIKLPVGMQFVAGYMEESKLFRVARQVEILTEN
ncbi:urethanase-like isoform X2 [Convolutriloba macropyga]|uniref:urethanase-like isoform X2 n=1 Tax=Convolutriloba macropyga TaxID=536237 RepID=UPI003F51F772